MYVAEFNALRINLLRALFNAHKFYNFSRPSITVIIRYSTNRYYTNRI